MMTLDTQPIAPARILIVEDNDNDIRRLRQLLKDKGFEVRVHKDPQLVIRTMETDRIDLVLLDVLLGEHGETYELCRQIKSTKGIERVPLIFITRLVGGSDKERAFHAGGDDYIAKDFQNEEVLARITVHLRREELERQLRQQNEQLQALRGKLKRFFSPELFEKMEKNAAQLSMCRRRVSICFWNIRDFSKLARAVNNQDSMIEFLREYYSVSAQVVNAYSGILDKYMGDGAMALFGVWDDGNSDQHRASALNAAKAALSGRARFAELFERWRLLWEESTLNAIPKVELACGITSADVMVGLTGVEFRDQFTAIGADVNLCSRLESRAGREFADLILVTRPFERLLNKQAIFADLGAVEDRQQGDQYPVFALKSLVEDNGGG
jgi:class 3 adenylate cyclase/glutaredoxin